MILENCPITIVIEPTYLAKDQPAPTSSSLVVYSTIQWSAIVIMLYDVITRYRVIQYVFRSTCYIYDSRMSPILLVVEIKYDLG